jgi:uncharacterized protein (UPF0261 family)
MELIARVFSQKLDKAKGRVSVFIPLQGFSSLSCKDGPLYDPEADMVFVKILKRSINKYLVNVIEMDCTINDPIFADAIVESFMPHIETQAT